MAKVEVIIPAYNAARFLPMAIESVIAQTFDDWRIVLVDDGSTDGTDALIAGYRDRLGEKMLYIRQPNAGMSAARNTGIRSSTGEFLALLDADDVWLPWRLEESMKSFARRPAAGISHGRCTRIDAAGEVLDTPPAPPLRYAEGRIAPYIYMRLLDLSCLTVTFRRVCVDQAGLFDESLRATEDRDLWVRIAQHWEVVYIPRVLAQYRLSPQTMTTDPERMRLAQMQFIEKHYGSPGCGFWARRVALSSIYRQRAEALTSRGQASAALGSGIRALALYPFHLNNLRTAGSLLLRYARWKVRQVLPPRPTHSLKPGRHAGEQGREQAGKP